MPPGVIAPPKAQPVTLGAQVGVTDQWLRVWRVLLFQQQGLAKLGVGVTPGEGINPTLIPGSNLSPIQDLGSAEDILSSEVPTGQFPTLESQAAGLRIHFQVTLGASPTPNQAEITIYNLSDDRVMKIIKEYNYVVLQAGYEYGYAGTIFTGSIKMYKKGHESATDSYIKIYAADGEIATNESVINQAIPPGTPGVVTHMRVFQTLSTTSSGDPTGVTAGEVDPADIVRPHNARTETYVGQSADHLRDFHNSNGNTQWYIINQQYHVAKLTSYEPGTIVEVNSKTGLVGWPEVTQDGLNFTMLINPALQLRGRVKLDNAQINQYFTPGGSTGAVYATASDSGQYYYPTSNDGIYTPVCINYEGDSRGGPWYMYVIAWAVDPTQAKEVAVIAGADKDQTNS